MTEFKRGDRVKVTVTATATRDFTPGTDRDIVLGNDAHDYPRHVIDAREPEITVEKLPDPLPTTPGSVVRGRRSGRTFMLLDSSEWVSQSDYLANTQGVVDVEVIYDAGVDK